MEFKVSIWINEENELTCMLYNNTFIRVKPELFMLLSDLFYHLNHSEFDNLS